MVIGRNIHLNDSGNSALFVGHKIVSVDKETGILTLDNGIAVIVLSNRGELATDNYDIDALQGFEHVIVSAAVDAETIGYTRQRYRLFVNSAEVKTNSDGNGCNATGYNLQVMLV